MSYKLLHQKDATESRDNRGDSTRRKLLSSAIDVFGRFGFEGASTRTLANIAGVNLQAIPYYFGGKEGLYLAVADYITSSISERVGNVVIQARKRIDDDLDEPMAVVEARNLLMGILTALAGVMLSDESEGWARFIMREQMQPTEAFARIYDGVMGPLLATIGRLTAVLVECDPESDQVRLQSIALVGSVMVFRVAHAAVFRQLHWHSVGPMEMASIQRLIEDVVASIGRSGQRP